MAFHYFKNAKCKWVGSEQSIDFSTNMIFIPVSCLHLTQHVSSIKQQKNDNFDMICKISNAADLTTDEISQ